MTWLRTVWDRFSLSKPKDRPSIVLDRGLRRLEAVNEDLRREHASVADLVQDIHAAAARGEHAIAGGEK